MNINAEISKVVGVERDYEHSLDAMHEAEKVLHSDHNKAWHYFKTLQGIVSKTKHSGTGLEFQTINATAAQRAEAFLKTLGFWKEEPVSEATVEGLR